MSDDKEISWGLVHSIIQKEKFVVNRVLVIPGECTDYKYHEVKHELLFCSSGEGVLILNDMEISFKAGEVFQIYKRDRHALKNIGTEPMIVYQVQYGDDCKYSDSVRIPYNE